VFELLSGRSRSRSGPPTLVVIGAHRDELAFGDGVVAGLDAARFAVLRIPKGLTGQRPRPEEREQFRHRHHELYRQILEHVAEPQRLLIDLHAGIDHRGFCADILCADPQVLQCIASQRHAREAGPDQAGRIRCVQLVADTALAALEPSCERSWTLARPEIPDSVWNRADLLYVGIEVYLRRRGAGTAAEWAFARQLVDAVTECGFAVRC